MKVKSNLGYKLVFIIALTVAILNAAARGYRPDFAPYDPEPNADTPAEAQNQAKKAADTQLHFPIYDKTGDPWTDLNRPHSIDLKDPPNVKDTFKYDSSANRYDFQSKLGDDFMRNPSYMTLGEYEKYQAQQQDEAYYQRRLDALMQFDKAPELPQMYKEGLFDRIFGNNTISVKPQGNVDVTFGGNWQHIQNPILPQRAQKYGVFDFDMQMNINLMAQIGDKMKLQISNNTKATFDYQNMQKLDYSGKEDELLKKIEAGNISFPLKSTLITGQQSLFGFKTQLQFGRLWLTGAMAQVKSKRKSLTVQSGAQAANFAVKADAYEQNRDFLLSQYFHDHYNDALKNYPVISSLVTINRIEVWVTNRSGTVNNVRNVLCFQDLGEATPYQTGLQSGSNPIRGGLPDNSANRLYTELVQNPLGRTQSYAVNGATSLGLTQGVDFEQTTARQLSASEFTFNAQLGYIMLNTQLNSDDVCGVAFRYTYKGKVYQVGDFAEDMPPDSTNPKVMYLKLLKGTSQRPALPTWKLMMKNVYPIGSTGVQKDNFTLNIDYQEPGGGEKRFMPDGKYEGTPFLTLLNLDRLNSQGQPNPDGVFDYVEGITINSQQGKIIFPVLEPFGQDLEYVTEGPNQNQLQAKYLYQILYDSTLTIALQSQRNDRYILKGTYKSSSSSDIYLGGFNIPPGSVSVTAGGTKLVENTDYSIDYSLGRVKILNSGILASGVPINIQYEDNSTFGFQQQNFMGLRADYYINKHLTVGSTLMRLTDKPFTQKVIFGEDPIKNTVAGADINYQNEVPGLTRLLDKLPVYATTAPSFINTTAEVAAIIPGHPTQITALDPEGTVYIDDFEGASSSYDMRFPAISWSASSTPNGAVDKNGKTLFPESNQNDELISGINRARLAWYTIEPTLVDPGTTVPGYVSKDPLQHYIRMVQVQDVFPNRPSLSLQSNLSTLDLGFYPNNRGQYNFDATNIDKNGFLLNPASRWGGIQRPITTTDFEAANVEYIEFWVMDPFINNTNSAGGSFYINLGDVSEDVLKDSRMFFENGIPSPFNAQQMDTTIFGYVPQFEQQITYAFSNDPSARAAQDVGYDGLSDSLAPGTQQLSEQTKFKDYLKQLTATLGASNPAYLAASHDPSNDDYHYYRGNDYDAMNNGFGLGVLGRYKLYNNPDGNSPISSPTALYTTAETTIPESEDINHDNTLNVNESYFQYRIDMKPNMQVGQNYIVSMQTSQVKLPNGNTENERWYQYKIPIRNYDHNVNGISDFRSIRFMRMFLSGWQDSVILRFAALQLDRSQWRSYDYSLLTPGETLPQVNQGLTDFEVTTVSIEENGARNPVPYVIPPGVARQLTTVASQQAIQQNEQSISLKTCALQDGDARAVYKTVNVDMRQFKNLRMFIHAESVLNEPEVRDADVDGFIRIGSDYTSNYYEYRMPLTMTPINTNLSSNDVLQIWPASNEMDITLQDLVNAKKKRDSAGIPVTVPFYTKDSKGNTIVVLGDPNIGTAKDVMLGVLNPKKTNLTPGDDGKPKCTEVWFDELRMAGTNNQSGYAAAGKASVQLADLGSINLAGSMHTIGYGNIDQNLQQRAQDKYYQYSASTNLALGKFFPKTWGVSLPLYVGYTQNASTPKYDPNNQDILVSDELSMAKSQRARDSINALVQDFTSITSINLTNVRISGNSAKPKKTFRMPWSIKNFDFSASFTQQFKHSPTISEDLLNTTKVGIGYVYNLKIKPIEPFKKLINSKSKWFMLIRDFNFTPFPNTYTMRNDLNRVMEQTTVRDISDGGPNYQMPPTFYKNFTWTRTYSVKWDLTKSIAIDYSATNISRITEPLGRIDTKSKEDSLWTQLQTLGQNTSFKQSLNASYTMPFSKLPLTDWINVKLTYGATYYWLGAAPVAYDLGNTIGNTQSKTIVGDFNLKALYDKNKWLKAVGAARAKKAEDKKPGGPGGALTKPGGGPGQGGPGGKQGGAHGNQQGGGNNGGPGGNTNGANGGGGNTGGAGNGGGSGPGGKGSSPANDTNANNSGSGGSAGGSQAANSQAALKSKLNATFPKVDLSHLTDDQLDSLVDVMDSIDHEKAAAEKAAKKAAKIAARKARKGKPPVLNNTQLVIGHIITMVNRLTINYSQTGSTTLPGWMDSTKYFGVNPASMQPGYDFAFGSQPNQAWLTQKALQRLLTRDSLFNSQFVQNYSQRLTATATIQPFNDLKLDLTINKTFSMNNTELYADTISMNNANPNAPQFHVFNPYQTGTYSISYMALNMMFNNASGNSPIYNQFLADGLVISKRLGLNNPYTNGVADPSDPRYMKGYTRFSQDVLIPSFLAAYTGYSPHSIALIDYSHNTIQQNPFQYFIPMPNWTLAYTGLAKLPFFAQYFTNITLKHSFTGTMNMNGFTSSLLYQDLFQLGYPSFIDSNSHNYVPYYTVPNVTITQAFNPLFSIDMAFKSKLTLKFEIRKSKTEALSLVDYQISENKSVEYIVGAGFRKKGVRLPFPILGVQKLQNELIFKMDVGFRDDKNSNTFLADNLNVVSRGQQVITIGPTLDYSVTQKLTLHLFYNRQQSIPYVSNAYPTTTTKAGLTFRFIFAQ